jgi:hypothetical protein
MGWPRTELVAKPSRRGAAIHELLPVAIFFAVCYNDFAPTELTKA